MFSPSTPNDLVYDYKQNRSFEQKSRFLRKIVFSERALSFKSSPLHTGLSRDVAGGGSDEAMMNEELLG